MAHEDLELKVKIISDEMEKHTKAGRVSDKEANSFKATLAEFERLIKTASSPSDWLKIKSLVGKLSNTLLDVTSSLSDVSKEATAYAKQLSQAEKAQEKVNKKIEQNVRGKGYQINEDLGKVTGLRKSAASGQDSWEKIFEEQQKGSDAIIGANGKPIAWSTFQSKMKSGNFTDEQKEKVAILERKIQERIDKTNILYQELRAELEQYKAELLKLQANPPKTSNAAFDSALEKTTAAKSAAEEAYSASKTAGNSGVDYGSPADFNNVTKAIDKQSTSLGKAFKQFSIYAIALRTVKRALNDAVKTIKDLDKYLTEQAMVTGKTRKETYELLGAYQNMAAEIGATTKEIAEVATQFMRQGKSTSDALTLTRAAVQAAKVAGISGAESVNYLTTALNGFQLAAEDAMKVSDKFAAIAATSATSYQEIATALSKVASQANIAGMSIDYTTALLAKGIETTREPAESIGTALKTIIARMRELTDYGKTLEDGMNINNVETQLSYVGIALRNTNGELRSTEEVLDELGGKWDTLSSNQQAAVAKALAGTRQQSRLIAMMNDYERVTELQAIAQRSAGATAAQAATYMEGMEAALNKVNVAWEKIVTAITDSEVIIDFITGVSEAMDSLGDFLGTTEGIITSIITIATIGTTIVGQKMLEYKLSKQQQLIMVQQQKRELEMNKIKAQSYKASQKLTTEELKQKAAKAKQAVLAQRQLIATKKRLAAEKGVTDATVEQEELTLQKLEKEYELAEQEVAKSEAADYTLNTYREQNALLNSQTSLVGKLQTGFMGLLTPLYLVIGAWKAITAAINTARAASKKKHQQEVTQDSAEVPLKASKGAGEIISQLGVYGIPIAAAVMLALAGIALGISAAVNKSKNSAENAAEHVNKLSNEIYKLQEKANAIKTMERQYDALDKKIIKTTEDQKKMSELLASTGDKLSEEEKEVFEGLQTDSQKYEYLLRIEEKAEREANQKREEQIRTLAKLNAAKRKEILTDKSNADYLQAVDAIYAINNNTLYQYIDTLDKVNDGVEQFTQAILENLSATEAWDLASNASKSRLYSLIDAINGASNGEVGFAEILTSTKYSLEEKIDAYNHLHDSVASLGDQELLNAFESAYGQWEQLQENMSQSAIKFMDSVGITIDKLNDFGLVLNKLGLTTEEASERISALFDLIASGADVSSAITNLFGDLLNEFAPDSKEYKALYNRILNAYQDAAGTGMLNMGQNLTSLKSQINSLYEKAAKWNTLSLTEQTEFIQDNYELFQGAGGAKLFEAFQTGNYNAIRDALATNDVLKEQIKLRLEQLKIDLGIAEAAADRNEAEIQWIKNQIALLEDYEDVTAEIYQADLELRLEQENKQLDLYKSYLEKQKDALSESLDKRKEAYQKYFDEVNRDIEDQEYIDQETILTSNLTKLSSSTDAGSRQQAKALEQQLQELEKERIQTLRERAQEAVLNNLDNEVSQINEKFDKLLENQAALLDAMNKEIAADPNDFVSRLATSGIENMTATQAEDYIKNNLIPAFDNSISGDILDGIKVRQEGGSLFLTVNNQEIELSGNNQQDLSRTILAALRSMGISI